MYVRNIWMCLCVATLNMVVNAFTFLPSRGGSVSSEPLLPLRSRGLSTWPLYGSPARGLGVAGLLKGELRAPTLSVP